MRSLLAAALLLACPLPVAAAPKVSLGMRQLDVHDAARFVAHVLRASVLVVADAKPITLDLETADGETALKALVRAAGLAQKKLAGVTIIAAPAILRHLEGVSLGAAGKAVTLDFCRASTRNIARLFADISGVKLEGETAGQATIIARSLGAVHGLQLVLALGGRVTSQGKLWRVSAREGLPRATTLPTPCPASANRAVLSCVSFEKLRVGAVASRGKERWASLLRAGDGPGAGAAHTVRVGELVGSGTGDPAPRKVIRIDATGVTLEGELRLALP